jgi:hypothetical protein
VGGEILDDAGLRRAQLEQLVAVRELGQLLRRALELGGDFDALGLQAPAVVRGDLAGLLLGLLDQRLRAADGRLLRAQVLLLLDALALLVGVENPAGEAVLGQLLEGLLLLDVERQHLLELGFRRLRRREVVVCLRQQRPFLRERILVGAHVRRVLCADLRVEFRRIVALAR